MTYTFKLARRLAVSRNFAMLSVLLLFAGCTGGDTTSPENSPVDVPESGIYAWRPRESTPVALLVSPRSVIVETNQLLQFRARGRNRAGDEVAAPVTWSTTGGTILSDGRFSAASVGTYQVTGRTRTREGLDMVQTSTINVVRRQAKLKSVDVTPGTATLNPGVSQAFVAIGRLASGDTVPIGVTWSAKGGTIDAGGLYVAGDTVGTFRVIATKNGETLADTATITISAPPSPPSDSAPAPPTIPIEPVPPPPDTTPTPPPPAPVLAQVTLLPVSATLALGTTKQFSVYGRTTVGDSIAVNAVFQATGGTITSGGLFTAGSTAGTFRVIATAGGLADTSAITITVPLGSGNTVGIPYGTFNLYGGGPAGPHSYDTPLSLGTGYFNLSTDFFSPDLALQRIQSARDRKLKLMTNMTGGNHSVYITDSVFDMAKWKAVMNSYNTPEIKAAVAAAVADGVIIGNSVMDEPNHRSWGGVMTKPIIDQMCAYVKGIFPTLPVGVVVVHWWRPTERYRVCDFIIDQYDWWQSPNGPGGGQSGNVTGWRDAALSMAAANGISIAFSMNILNGGIQDIVVPIEWTCPLSTTGGFGLRSPVCRMHASQVRDWGLILGRAGCFLTMWRYDADFMSNSANLQAFRDVAADLATRPAKSCRRTG